MRIRANSVLAGLTEDQLNKLYDWIASGMTYRDVQERCAQPPPNGFGLDVHLKTLWSFFKAQRRHRHAEELAESKFDDLTDGDPEKLLQNVRVELAHACYDLAHHNEDSAANSLSRITHRIDRIKLDQQRVTVEQQRLALEREFLAEKQRQFNFNAARAAAKHAHKIKEVVKTKGLDAEDKLWKITDLVFGPPPTQPLEQSAPSSKSTEQNTTQP